MPTSSPPPLPRVRVGHKHRLPSKSTCLFRDFTPAPIIKKKALPGLRVVSSSASVLEPDRAFGFQVVGAVLAKVAKGYREHELLGPTFHSTLQLSPYGFL